MKPRRRGFTLYEALLTLLLLFVVLGLASDLFTQYSSVLRFSAAKTTTLTTMQVALQQMIADVQQAQTIESPASVGAVALDLKFVMVDPSNPTWLSNSTSLPAPGWVPVLTPATTSFFIEVDYHLSDGTVYPASSLVRDVGPPGGPPTSSTEIAQNLSLQVTGLPAWSGPSVNAVQIQLAMQESMRVFVINATAVKPL